MSSSAAAACALLAAFALGACSSSEPPDGSHFAVGGQGAAAPASGAGGLGGTGLGGGPARNAYAFDLDEDGTNESDLAVVPCAADPATSCLSLKSEKLGDDELLLSSAPATGLHVGVMGKHFWSLYHSFVKNTFQYPYGATPVITRPGDMMNRCIHRFSDSLARAGATPVTVYDEFTSDPPADDCVAQQYAEVTSGFTPEAMAAWNECAKASFLPAIGSWTVHVLDAETGVALGAMPNAYAWGKSTRLLPGGETAILLESFSDKVRFDQVGHAAGPMTVVGIASDFTWEQHGAFPVAGRPKLRYGEPIEGATGATWSGIVELETTDADGDGLDEIVLEGGERVGYSMSAGAFVTK